MVSIRPTAAILLFIAVAPADLGNRLAAASAVMTTLSGVVRDDAGRVLEGVEVLILAPEGRREGAVDRAVSDASGRFLIGAISPGVYRVAAIKSGYIAALGRVNTLLRSSVELVLHPVPKEGDPGANRVQDDLSWTLRIPPRSILRELDGGALLASRDTGGARAFVIRMQDSLRGEVDHVLALGSWRRGSSGRSSSLEGNETRMRFAGTLGERGAIQVRGRRGSLDSSSGPSSTAAVSSAASDLDLDVAYDTSDDASLAMRAFYSSGDLEVADFPGPDGTGVRQRQRSWGYDAKWRTQVDSSSRVAVQVGFRDANLDLANGLAVGTDPALRDASNRGIGAQGSYENVVGNRHLVRVGVRAQRLSLGAPSARAVRGSGTSTSDGATGWSVLLDSDDQWSVSGPMVMTYGIAVREGSDGQSGTTLAPRIGGSWTSGDLEARAEVSYFASTNRPAASRGAASHDDRSPFGYELEWRSRLSSTLSLRGTASYVPSRAVVWGVGEEAREIGSLYVTDGLASDRVIALTLERAAASATVTLRVARGRAEGVLAPALDDVPVVLLSERALDYDAVRFGIKAPHAGSTVSFQYRAIREHSGSDGRAADPLRTAELDFVQELARFAGGRASCRLLLAAGSFLGPAPDAYESGPAELRHLVAVHTRVAAGVSLAF